MEKRIGIDTYTFIELFSGEGNRMKRVEPTLRQVIEGDSKGVISSAVLTELYYHLNRCYGKERTEYWIIYLQNLPNMEIINLDAETAILASKLRTKYSHPQKFLGRNFCGRLNLSPRKSPKDFLGSRYYKKNFKELSYLDCIHLATAIKSNCIAFITGDKDFSGIEEINVKII